jgi:hypothetical protein
MTVWGVGHGDWGTDPLLLQRGAVCAEYQLLRGRSEVCKACNGQVFVVEVGVVADDVVGL